MRRRAFLRGSAALAAAATLPSWTGCANPFLPLPNFSGLDHIVVTMMENRSFDHFLGWLPNADARQSDLAFPDAGGTLHPTFALAPDYMGCSYSPPSPSFDGGRAQYDEGKMDGFLRVESPFAIGYYGPADVPFLAQAALHFTVLDRYFCSTMSPTGPNRLFVHAAQSDRIDDDARPTTIPTIWDRLLAAGVSCRYYFPVFSGVEFPFLSLWSGKYDAISAPYATFVSDVTAGRLPSVAYVEPPFGHNFIPGSDQHPPADIRSGDAFLSQVYRLLVNSPQWRRTLWLITYDEWGGFFDHVPPPRAAAANPADTDVVGGKQLLGMRVPAVIVSPFAQGDPANNRVNSLVFDHTSVLKLIEWRWNLRPLTARDGGDDVANLALALDFAHPRFDPPDLPQPPDPGPGACP